MRRAVLVLTLAAGVSLAAPGAASAITFGANLARTPDNAATCITVQFFPIYGPNCSVTSVNLLTGETTVPPGGEGVVSVVRVRVGNATGPMQVALEEALRKDNPGDPGHPTYACCKLIGLSQVFTPAANAITEIPVNFRVKQSLTPEESGYFVDDHLSLSILNGNVPIPAALEPNASVGIWYPAWQTIGEERASVYGTSGLQVLMNAEWNPLPGAAPGGGAAAPQGPAGIVPLTVPQAVTVRNGVALFPLVCNLDAVCRGILRLQSLQAAGAASLFAAASAKPANGARKPITYAAASFSIDPHATKKVKVTLKPAGQRLLRKHQRAKVWLNVTMKGGVTRVAPAKVTLRRDPA